MKKGKIILIFGISGVGKTYYENLLSKKFNMYPLKKVTTRKKREKEKNKGVSKEQFEKMIYNNEFFIYTKIYDEYYGYEKKEIEKIEEGFYLIGDCYYKLIGKLRELLGEDLITICIQPYDLQNTLNLIKDERVDYKQRIESAKKEYMYLKNNKHFFDYYFYTKYDTTTDDEIISQISKCIQYNMEVN